MDNFYQSPVTTNTQGDNVNAILTSERINTSDDLAKTLKGLTINDAGYYNSDKNDSEGDPASNPKVDTHTSDGMKRKVTDTRNGNLQHKLLINRTLLIITTPIDPLIDNRVATYGASTIKLATPFTTEVITDAACSSAQVLWTHGYVSSTGRDGIIKDHCDIAVGSSWMKSPVLIGGTTVSPTSGIMGSHDIVSIHGSTGSVEVRDAQNLNNSIDGNLD